MQGVIVFLLIAMAIAVWWSFPELRKSETSQLPATVSQSQVSQNVSEILPQTKTDSGIKSIKEGVKLPAILIDTFIKYGPLEKEIIEDTNRVIFEFGAKVFPEGTKGQISFETKIEGFDKDWQKTYSSERTIDLPLGPKEYTFLVRAKINEILDPTPAKRNFKINVSPYFKKLVITNVQPPNFYRPSLITLISQLGWEEKNNITGWQIEGKNGSFTIPQGVEKYDSSNPLFKEDILVKAGDRIYISSDYSPLGNRRINFRPNKCLGYLASSYNFTIPVQKNCPQPRIDRLPRYLSDNCQKYIASRTPCETLQSERLAKWDIFRDSLCLDYITQNFNYPGCFGNYSQDADFLTNEWHIYMNITNPENEIIDFQKDTIYLRDKAGLLIDKYSY